jgi:hypothetical protein
VTGRAAFGLVGSVIAISAVSILEKTSCEDCLPKSAQFGLRLSLRVASSVQVR